MATVRSVIEGALRKIEELGEGQTMSSEQGQDGLEALVDLLDSWSIEAGMVWTETQEDFTVNGGDGLYTIGTGGDLNTTRPTRVRYAVIDDGGTKTKLEIIGAKEYSEMYDDDDTGRPEYLYYDGNYPLANIKLYPVPDQSYTLTLYSEKPLSTFSNLSDVISAPNGWLRLMKYNLAAEIAPEYGKQASQTVISVAMESKRLCKIQNLRNDTVTAVIDDGLTGGTPYNIYRGGL